MAGQHASRYFSDDGQTQFDQLLNHAYHFSFHLQKRSKSKVPPIPPLLVSKDIDAVESQRLERIQAARRIKRVKSTQSRRSYSADSRHEDGGGGSSCLPTCLRGQRRSDKDRLYRSRQESSCSDFPSPDSNPPSYDGACRGRPRCNSGIEENAALLVDVTSSSHRSLQYIACGQLVAAGRQVEW
ncbi:hypothetical protein RRG08_032633 [Elysia crispata]|uniref:Uncharacterized protein n=1 Tax=Elysia crispata TaxID=231223 RepID=A0AAE0XZN8_9GAST|nr:hypothetical protein RRG08_032633 [Elysia crispata]